MNRLSHSFIVYLLTGLVIASITSGCSLMNVAVPNVIGMTTGDAKTAITATKLALGTVSEQHHDTIPSGQVIDQEPVAGTRLAQCSKVNLVISSGPAMVSVPDLVGMTQETALVTIAGVNLTASSIIQQSHDDIPAGRVISQAPPAGVMVSSGSSIELVVSSGPRTVTVPDLSGTRKAEAIAALEAVGLIPGMVTTQHNEFIPEDYVISQEPLAGTEVHYGTQIALLISSGPASIIVPDVVGMTELAARAAIEAIDLTVGTILQQPHDVVPEGQVITQNPAAGASVSRLTTIHLVVSSGPELIIIPDVVGKTESAARTAIEAVYLTVGTIIEQHHPTIQIGQVIEQEPVAGTGVIRSTSVHLVLSSGPKVVIVPDVTGMTKENAQNEIKSAELSVGNIEVQHHSSVPTGQVISQVPVAGTEVYQGSNVALVLSSGPVMVTVPNVAGMTEPYARLAIEVSGLTVGTLITQYHNTVPEGQVISQTPAAGINVPHGSKVSFTLSMGPRMVTVPDVVGMSESYAQLAIGIAQLTLGTTTEQLHETIPPYHVISQEPEAGSVVVQNSTINLVISANRVIDNEYTVILPGNVKLVFVWIPPGVFFMGRYTEEEGSTEWETPQHLVTIPKGFLMSKYQITQAQWNAIMRYNPSHFFGANRPVEQVSWNDIRDEDGFLDQLNAKFPKYNFRLPSEAEWEYAYRAGKSTRFYWGHDPDYTLIDDYAWHRYNSSDQTHNVGLKLPNAWGLYDMAGNVLEWCEDDWYDYYHASSRDGSPMVDTPRGSFRLVRGGSYYYPQVYCRAAYRLNLYPQIRLSLLGFRLVLDLDTE